MFAMTNEDSRTYF